MLVLGVELPIHVQGLTVERLGPCVVPTVSLHKAEIFHAVGQFGVSLGVLILGVQFLVHGQGLAQQRLGYRVVATGL